MTLSKPVLAIIWVVIALAVVWTGIAVMSMLGRESAPSAPLEAPTPYPTYTPYPIPTPRPPSTPLPAAPAPTPQPTYTPLPTYTPQPTPRPRVVTLVVTATPRSEVVNTPNPRATTTQRNIATATPVATATPIPKLEVTQSGTISAGEYHTCALQSNEWVCWGSNRFGELDIPDGNFVTMSAGSGYTCGLRSTDGFAVCWGYNREGQAYVPEFEFVAISAGTGTTCGLLPIGSPVCWGSRAKYALEFASDPPRHATYEVFDTHKIKIDGFFAYRHRQHTFAEISVGREIACGLRSDGIIRCRDKYNLNNIPKPSDGSQFAAVSISHEHACALLVTGEALCWGNNGYGQLEPPDGQFTTISAGSHHSCGLLWRTGEAVCWGRNNFGQSAPPAGNFAAISAGGNHTCGLRHSGEAVCWGSNEFGQSSPPGTRAQPAPSSFDAATVLARFSTADAVEGEARANAASRIIAEYESGDADDARVLDLLQTLAPELSADERRRAAAALTELSVDDDWDDSDTVAAVNHLATIITGGDFDAEASIAAATELVELYEDGELDAGRALDLMDTIAPMLSIDERTRAAGALARLSADEDWGNADKMEAASEAFRLVTGVPLKAQERVGAAVDLTGAGIKAFGGAGFTDRDIDVGTQVIKKAITGDIQGIINLVFGR